MVNSPKIRHSKPRRDPVTIDLDAEPVKAEASAEAASAAKASSTPADTGAPEKVAGKPPLDEIAPKASSDAGTKSTFGREQPAASTQPPAADKTPPKSPPPSPPRTESRRGGVSAIAAGLIGGVVALAGAGALQYGGLLPQLGGNSAATAEIDGLRAEIATLRDQVAAAPAPENFAPRLDELAAGLNETRTQLQALQAGGSTSPEAAAALDERFKTLEAAVASAQQGGQAVDLAPLNQRLDALDAAIAEAKQAAAGATAPLEERIASLEAKVQDLGGKVAEQAEQPSAALAIAASALKATIDRGDPFMTELETYASIAPQSAEIEALRGLAAAGVPSRTAIDDAFPAAANAMIATAKAEDPNAGFLDRLMSSAQSLVQVRPVGTVEGEDAPAIVARMEVALKKGDYSGAVAEYDKLAEPAKAAGADFIAKVKARQAADGLIGTILSAALKA
nr:mitofilin family membrane protein [Mesorhizobium sp.]